MALTKLNYTGQGTIPASRISAGSIDLTSKVTGILPSANGGSVTSPIFKLNPTGSHTITNNSSTTVPLSVAAIDTHNLHNSSNYTITFTAATAGIYFISGTARLLYSPTRFRVFININDSNVFTNEETTNGNAGGGSYQSTNANTIQTVSSGDVLKMRIYFLATANQSLYPSPDSVELSGFRIGI